MPKVLVAEDLRDEEVIDAFLMMQEGVCPENVIRYLRGEEMKLLDPDQFEVQIQNRYEAIELLKFRTRTGSQAVIGVPLPHDGIPPQDHLSPR